VVKNLITPKAHSRGYHLIIGERGTGKTHLVKLILSEMKSPKGVAYVDVPIREDRPITVVELMETALHLRIGEELMSPDKKSMHLFRVSIVCG
jgi:ABC-type Mn2+/Zn2+ transport system ATPase subunit